MSTQAGYQTHSELSLVPDSTAKPLAVLNGYNLGNRTLIASIPFMDFLSMSAVANEVGLSESELFAGEEIAQRELNPTHATELARYMLKGIVHDVIQSKLHASTPTKPSPSLALIAEKLGPQTYFALQPIVVNIRTLGKAWRLKTNFETRQPTEQMYVWLNNDDKLFVVDGQHRRQAIRILHRWLEDIDMNREIPKRPDFYPSEAREKLTPPLIHAWREIYDFMREKCTLAVEIHLGLDAGQERQLFHDLNNLGKRVSEKIAVEFDSSNLINNFIKEDLSDITHLSHTTLVKINAPLFLNAKNIKKGISPYLFRDRRSIAREFWSTLSKLDGFGKPNHNALSDVVTLKALAKLTFDLAWAKSSGSESIAIEFLRELNRVEWSYENPIWRYYELSDKERSKAKISTLGAYLPAPPRDLGKWDESTKTFIFSSKHNDIYQIIGDMVRWQLGLPRRIESVTTQ